jgi:ubiquinone/menaquinone biosynthesis C-methylase UbiE
VTFVIGDATALDFPDNRFSAAACFTMLQHVPTRQLQDRLLSEVLRVLRPGGVLVAADSLASPELAAADVLERPEPATRKGEGSIYEPIDGICPVC